MASPRSVMGSAKVSISSIVSKEEGESQDGTDELDLAKALRPCLITPRANPHSIYPLGDPCPRSSHIQDRRLTRVLYHSQHSDNLNLTTPQCHSTIPTYWSRCTTAWQHLQSPLQTRLPVDRETSSTRFAIPGPRIRLHIPFRRPRLIALRLTRNLLRNPSWLSTRI